jgi:hypothetical protein
VVQLEPEQLILEVGAVATELQTAVLVVLVLLFSLLL